MLLRVIDIFRLEPLEVGNIDITNQCVEFVWRVFILVSLPGESNPDSVWNVSDAFGPEIFIESSVDANVPSAHLLLRKLLDLLDGSRCPFLETDAMKPLVQVHSVLSGDHLVQGRFRLLGLPCFLRHFNWCRDETSRLKERR